MTDQRAEHVEPHPAVGIGPALGLRHEIELTFRLTVDNAAAALLPGVLGTAAACAHHGVVGGALLVQLAQSLGLFALYLYVFDAANQAAAGPEDLVNKPYRPIPAGLVTPEGLRRRFWLAMALYTLLGAVTGTLAWVLLWQAVVIGLNVLSSPGQYLYVKPVAMYAGIISQQAAAWQVVAPLDRTAWTWVLTLSVAFSVGMRFEDVRDMDGDRMCGRRTLPLVIGHWPVRAWFAVVSLGLPFAAYYLLIVPADAGPVPVAVCLAVLVAMNWTAAVLSVLTRTVRSDRISYQLHCLSYCATVACGIALL